MADLVRFTETMRGWLAPMAGDADPLTHERGAAAARAAGVTSLFVLTVVSPDVAGMVTDPRHRSPAYGCLIAPALHARPLRVTRGHLDLFADADATGRVLHMGYGLDLVDDEGRPFHLRGIKEVCRRRWFPTALLDTTTLFVDVFRGEEARPALRGILYMGPVGFLAQMASFRGEGGWLGLRGIVQYLAYYTRRVLKVSLGPRVAPLRPTWSVAPGQALPSG